MCVSVCVWDPVKEEITRFFGSLHSEHSSSLLLLLRQRERVCLCVWISCSLEANDSANDQSVRRRSEEEGKEEVTDHADMHTLTHTPALTQQKIGEQGRIMH